MKSALEFSGPVVNGKLPEAVDQKIAAGIRMLDGKKALVSISEIKRTRSGQQNRYYWSCVVGLITEAFREAGNMVSPEEVHDFLKSEVGKLNQVFVTMEGQVLRGPGSTTRLTTTEFSNYIEAVKAWAADMLDLKIPSPDEAF